jgi:hypothetical protein
MLNSMIEIGTNHGSTIELGLLAIFAGIVITTITVALKETK